jgi:hypothetical protein
MVKWRQQLAAMSQKLEKIKQSSFTVKRPIICSSSEDGAYGQQKVFIKVSPFPQKSSLYRSQK